MSLSPSWRMTPGGVIDAAIVLTLVGFWLLCGPHGSERGVLDVAIPVSLSGVYLVARRLLSSSSPLPAGIGLWGVHGLVGLAAIGLSMWTSASPTAIAVESHSNWILAFCLTAIVIQTLIAVFAVRRLIAGLARQCSDVVGCGICVTYAVMVGGWALRHLK